MEKNNMILGLVAAKDNSNRFPGKNKYIFEKVPLFWHSVQPLLDSDKINDVFVITNSEFIKSYCEKRNVSVIWRSKNSSRDEDKLINILRYAYYTLDKEYDIIVSIMANCPGHSKKEINEAISFLSKNNLREVRSFNNGQEAGLMVLSKEIMENNYDISYYIGSVNTDAREIHVKKDLYEN